MRSLVLGSFGVEMENIFKLSLCSVKRTFLSYASAKSRHKWDTSRMFHCLSLHLNHLFKKVLLLPQ